jgi:hypothetical protein
MIGRLQRRSEGIARLRIGSVATLSRNYQENRIRPLLAETYVVLKLEPGVLDVFSHAWCCTSSMSFSRTKRCPRAPSGRSTAPSSAVSPSCSSAVRERIHASSIATSST